MESHEISRYSTQQIAITEVKNLEISSSLNNVPSKRYKVTITKTRKKESTSTLNFFPAVMTSLRARSTRKTLLSVRPVRISRPTIIEMTTEIHRNNMESNDHEALNQSKTIFTIATEVSPVTTADEFSNSSRTQHFDNSIFNRDIIGVQKILTDGKNYETTVIPSKTLITNEASRMNNIKYKTLVKLSNRPVRPIISTIFRTNYSSIPSFVSDTSSSYSIKRFKQTMSQVTMQSFNFKQYNIFASSSNIENPSKSDDTNPTHALLKSSMAVGNLHATDISESVMTSGLVLGDKNMAFHNSDEACHLALRLNSSQILVSNKNVNEAGNKIDSKSTLKLTENIITSTRLRTYTYVITKINKLKTEVTSSTTIRPYVKIFTLTVPVTAFSITATEGLMNYSAVSATTQLGYRYYLSQIMDNMDGVQEQEGRKMNLATRIMSNGVEVIIAGPSPAFRWENLDLQPTMTLSDSVVMVMPTEDPNEFVTKTCTTTFTYLNTITKDGRLFVSTDQQIVANTATEERHRKPGSESSAVTLEASPTLRTEIFKTTYTYLTLNAEYSDIDHALGSSQKVITNTITVPQHYLDMILEPSQFLPPRTNTYISTRRHKKTFVDNGLPKIKTDCETITQLIITDLATTLPRSTSVTTTLTALDYVEDSSVTDVSQPYYITHAYYDSYQEMKNNITIRPNLAISTDIEAEYASSRPPSINSQVSATVTKHINHDSTVENVHAIPKKKYQDSSDSTDSTSILTRPWDTSTVQIMTGLLPFDIVNKKPNSDKMSVEKRSINHASNDNQDAQDRTSENVMGSTLRLRHTSSHNLNEIASNCNLNFDSV